MRKAPHRFAMPEQARDYSYLYSVICYLYSVICTLFQEHPCVSKVNMHAVLVRLARIEIFILSKVYSV